MLFKSGWLWYSTGFQKARRPVLYSKTTALLLKTSRKLEEAQE